MVARMDQGDDISARLVRMRDAIGSAYGFQARSLDRAVSRAGRRLPRGVRGALKLAVAAEGFGGNPKLLRHVARTDLAQAEAALSAHLKTVDRSALRKQAAFHWVAQVAFYVFLVFGCLGLWMAMSGRSPV